MIEGEHPMKNSYTRASKRKSKKPTTNTTEHRAISEINKRKHQKQSKHQNQSQTSAQQHKQKLYQNP